MGLKILVYSMGIRYMLWLFGAFIAIWVYLSHFGLLYQEKSGNPGANPTIASYNASVVNFCNATGSPEVF
jgi:hypothetical protein